METVFKRAHSAPAVLELIEGPGVSDAAILPNSPPKLSEIDEVVAHTSLVADNPGEKANHGEGPDHPAGKARHGIGFLHVGLDLHHSAISTALSPTSSLNGGNLLLEKRFVREKREGEKASTMAAAANVGRSGCYNDHGRSRARS